jgi:hypothetical protein
MVGSLSAGRDFGMTVAHYRIYELDFADHVTDGYSVGSGASGPARQFITTRPRPGILDKAPA